MDDAKEHPPLVQTGGGLRRKERKTEFLPYPSCITAVNWATAVPLPLKPRSNATANIFD
jgi:hypothetical protein